MENGLTRKIRDRFSTEEGDYGIPVVHRDAQTGMVFGWHCHCKDRSKCMCLKKTKEGLNKVSVK